MFTHSPGMPQQVSSAGGQASPVVQQGVPSVVPHVSVLDMHVFVAVSQVSPGSQGCLVGSVQQGNLAAPQVGVGGGVVEDTQRRVVGSQTRATAHWGAVGQQG